MNWLATRAAIQGIAIPALRKTLVLLIGAILAAFWAAAAFAQDKFFNSAGIPVHFVDAGVGEPIVLVHGYTQDLEREWIDSGVFANLATDHRVVAFDCVGMGRAASRCGTSGLNVRLD